MVYISFGFIFVFFFFIILLYVVDRIRTYHLIQNLFSQFLGSEKQEKQISERFFISLLKELSNLFYASISTLYKYNDKKRKTSLSFFYNRKKKLESVKKFFNKKEIFISRRESKEIIKGYLSQELKKNIIFNNNETRSFSNNYLVFPIFKNGTELDSFYLFFFNSPLSLLRAKKIFILSNKNLQKILLDLHLVVRTREESIVSNLLNRIKDYAFLILDNDFQIKSWNSGAYYIFGYNQDAINNKSIFNLIFPEEIEYIKKYFENSKNKEEIKIKTKMVDSKQSIIFCELQLKQVKIDDVLSGYSLLIKDITKNEVLKENMENKTLINRSIVENNRDGILFINEENRIMYANDKLKNILQTQVNMIGIDISYIFSLKDADNIKTKIKEIRDSSIDMNFADLKFGEFWYNVRFFKVNNKNAGKKDIYKGVILFFIDNTYRIKTRMELEEKTRQLELFNQKLLKDLESAKAMQTSLIPREEIINRKITTTSIYKLSDQLGGDFYYFEEIKIDENIYYPVLVADVSGHGVAASMLSVLVKDIYNQFKRKAEKNKEVHPANFINLLNNKMNQLHIEGTSFVTVFFALFDITQREVIYSSAGHPSMIKMTKKQTEALKIENSPPTGLFENRMYYQKKTKFQKGDCFFIYSDGILDVFSDENTYNKGFRDFIEKQKGKKAKEIKILLESEIEKFTSISDKEKDDMTLVMIEIK